MKNKLFICIVLLASSFVSSCTENLRAHNAKTWKEVVNYDYAGSILGVLGFSEAFPSTRTALAKEDNALCLYNDSENRIATVDGVNDEFYYRRCTLSPYTNNIPQRFEGR